MIQQLTLTQQHWQEIQEHVSAHTPLEACGLLAGKNNQVEKVIVVHNQAQSPIRFVMDPYEQLKAFDRIESNGLELIGIFHSHPAGPETASVTDIPEAAFGSRAANQFKRRRDRRIRATSHADGCFLL